MISILRDTKDVLMITAYKSGAEVIPFIKTYCNLPAAIVSIGRETEKNKWQWHYAGVNVIFLLALGLHWIVCIHV